MNYQNPNKIATIFLEEKTSKNGKVYYSGIHVDGRKLIAFLNRAISGVEYLDILISQPLKPEDKKPEKIEYEEVPV